jgi:hypothetical protein
VEGGKGVMGCLYLLTVLPLLAVFFSKHDSEFLAAKSGVGKSVYKVNSTLTPKVP